MDLYQCLTSPMGAIAASIQTVQCLLSKWWKGTKRMKIDDLNELESAAILLADGEVCCYDHHGYCQSHFLHERPCPMEIINRYDKELEAQ